MASLLILVKPGESEANLLDDDSIARQVPWTVRDGTVETNVPAVKKVFPRQCNQRAIASQCAANLNAAFRDDDIHSDRS